jgi:hypothetical protein
MPHLLLFSAFSFSTDSSTDRRLDPFQFNLCLWNLEGLDPPYGRMRANSRDEDEDLIASTMYTSLSTCDMFVLPGLRNHTTAENLVSAMAAHDFKGFWRYPQIGNYDSTVLSRINITDEIPFRPNEFPYPIKNSKCNYTGSGTALMNLSFYSKVTFHDPVPDTFVISVRFKSGADASACAWREAQASLLCKVIQQNVSSGDHVFVAGSFESDASEGYGQVLRGCGLTEISYPTFGPKDAYSRELRDDAKTKVLWDLIWVNEAVLKSGYLDELMFFDVTNVESLNIAANTRPMTLFVHQPMTPRWKRFEIVWSTVLPTVSIGYFVWLLFFSRNKIEPIRKVYTSLGTSSE